MIIFREHKGGLAESMKTVKEFKHFDDMYKYVANMYKSGYPDLTWKDVTVDTSSMMDDTRVGWHDSMYVCIKPKGVNSPMCIGMCAVNYDRQKSLST